LAEKYIEKDVKNNIGLIMKSKVKIPPNVCCFCGAKIIKKSQDEEVITFECGSEADTHIWIQRWDWLRSAKCYGLMEEEVPNGVFVKKEDCKEPEEPSVDIMLMEPI
jgi:hypothetical protein